MSKIHIRITLDQVAHYTPAQRAAVLAAYPAHEREARTRCAVMMPRVARTEPRCR